jgi:aspartokinase
MARTTRSAQEIVRNAIERDGVIRHGLARRLINVRALARSIERTAPEEASFDALLSAIRRYPIPKEPMERAGPGRSILKIRLKNNVMVVVVRDRPRVQPMLARFAGEIHDAEGETFRMVWSSETVSVTIDSKNLSRLQALLPGPSIVRKLGNLAELVVDMSPEIESYPGSLAAITTELAMNDVNVVQMSTVGPGRIIVLVHERDALRGYQALEGLSKAS